MPCKWLWTLALLRPRPSANVGGAFLPVLFFRSYFESAIFEPSGLIERGVT
jgi:hypothetical protein